MNFEPTDRVIELSARLRAFMDEHVHPAENTFREHFASTANKWKTPPLVEELKQQARAEGLWNLFLPHHKQGAGLSNLEYAPLAEIMGPIPTIGITATSYRTRRFQPSGGRNRQQRLSGYFRTFGPHFRVSPPEGSANGSANRPECRSILDRPAIIRRETGKGGGVCSLRRTSLRCHFP